MTSPLHDGLSIAFALLGAPLCVLLADRLPRQILAEHNRDVAHLRGEPPPAPVRWRDSVAALHRWPNLLLLLALLLALALMQPWSAANVGGWALAVYVGVLLMLARTDAEHQLLPDALTLGLLWVGLLLQVTPGLETVGAQEAIVGAVIGYLPFRLLGLLYQQWRGFDGMGQGDMKLLAAAGAWWGPWVPLQAFVLGTVLSLLPWLLARLSGRLAANQHFPFGPALVGALLLLLWRGGIPLP